MGAIQEIYPTLDERVNFMKGLVRVSRADSKITEEEAMFFINAASNLELSETQISFLKSALHDQSMSLPMDKQTKKQSLFLIKEAIQLCFVDGHFSDSERAELGKIGAELSISSDEISSIEMWVREGIEWVKRGDELISILERK